jgi:hypothetical protein
VCGEHQWV